jgi:N-acetylmuramoyl-L-alanine amidase
MTSRELFARLIRCEAEGEGLDGMKAVATIVMNRVHVADGEYQRVNQGDLRNVIMQPFQFTCVMDVVYGEYNPQNVWNMSAEPIHFEVADWALSGNVLPAVEPCLWYYNPFSPACENLFPRNGTGSLFNRIGEHCFYQPTSLYYQT